MRIFRDYRHLPSDLSGSVVAVGNFDGVHLGHRAVIGEAGRIAHADGAPWAVLTLEPHPRTLFNPEGPPFRLTPFAEKARLIGELGPAALIVLPFDHALARMPARTFVETVIAQGLAARHVVCGHDFAFGQGRKGTPELLLWLGDEFGFGFTCVKEVRDGGGEPYSSTRIREYLKAGDTPAAAALLGRPFEIAGIVTAGEQRGRVLGFPTANIDLGEQVRPAHGVYAVRVTICGDETGPVYRDGAAYIGPRPTFGGTEVLLEVHLFDFTGELYGRYMRVALFDHLRGDMTFSGTDDLQRQLMADCARARDVLAAIPCGAMAPSDDIP